MPGRADLQKGEESRAISGDEGKDPSTRRGSNEPEAPARKGSRRVLQDPTVVALLIIGIPIIAVGIAIEPFGVTEVNEAPTKDFLAAAVGVLSALLLGFIFQVRLLLRGLEKLFNLWLAVLMTVLFLLIVGFGIGDALTALNACREIRCGEPDDSTVVMTALLMSGLLLFIAVVLAVYEDYADSSRGPSASGRVQ